MLDEKMKQQLLAILADDIDKGDVTAALLKPLQCTARIIAQESCKALAGIKEVCFLFRSKEVKAEPKVKDGEVVAKDSTVIELSGLNSNIVQVERTALNIIGRMSGVASICKEAQEIAGDNAKVAITRKTMPGFNLFDCKAAQLAGIWPHRLNLHSFVLIKDNHLLFFNSASEAVRKAREKYQEKIKVEVETDNVEQALDVAKEKPDIIMLDNFSPAEAADTIKKLRAITDAKLELSGGVTMENLEQYAAAKPDIISMGSLTHAAASKNFSLEIMK